MLPIIDACADDVSEARELEAGGHIVPLDRVLVEARRLQPGRILEVELAHEHHGYVYEVKVLDAGGRFWELEFDAASGQLVEREQELGQEREREQED
jgi:uncharacterized membrane protein YkoI